MAGVDLADMGMQVIREALESYVDPKLAALVLFGALQAVPDGTVPQSSDGILSFARGPLHEELERRVGPRQASMVASNLMQILSSALAPPDALPLSIEVDLPDMSDAPEPGAPAGMARRRRRRRASQEGTRSLPHGAGPVSLLVLARSQRLMKQLRAALGAHRVAAAATPDLVTLAQLHEALGPNIVIIDGQDAADVPPAAVATALLEAPSRPLLIIWASDQPWGSAVSKALQLQSIPCARVPRSEGHEPLLDYVRSRAG